MYTYLVVLKVWQFHWVVDVVICSTTVRNNKLLWGTGLCCNIIVFNIVILFNTLSRPYLSGLLVCVWKEIFFAVFVRLPHGIVSCCIEIVPWARILACFACVEVIHIVSMSGTVIPVCKAFYLNLILLLLNIVSTPGIPVHQNPRNPRFQPHEHWKKTAVTKRKLAGSTNSN